MSREKTTLCTQLTLSKRFLKYECSLVKCKDVCAVAPGLAVKGIIKIHNNALNFECSVGDFGEK